MTLLVKNLLNQVPKEPCVAIGKHTFMIFLVTKVCPVWQNGEETRQTGPFLSSDANKCG